MVAVLTRDCGAINKLLPIGYFFVSQQTGVACPVLSLLLNFYPTLPLSSQNIMPAEIDIQPFHDVLTRLEEALAERAANPENTYLRDAVILRFTFTFEVAVSTLRRYLEEIAAIRSSNRMSPRRCLREAADLGLIAECADWMLHVDNRNRAVHAYSEPMADAIAAIAPAFAADARALLNAMAQGIADGG